MTRATAAGDLGSVPARRSPHRRRKATLTCHQCGHASPTDGDWIVVLDPAGLASLRCPVCRAHLTTRWLDRGSVPPGWCEHRERG